MDTVGKLLRSAPYFQVADLEAAASHYETAFGFAREYEGGNPPEFAVAWVRMNKGDAEV